MTKEGREKLNSIRFDWGDQPSIMISPFKKQTWETCFAQLEDYKKANGDCNVSQKDSHNVELRGWVGTQRHLKKKNN
jgi:hypothetical protein